jgi:hypothetical protein
MRHDDIIEETSFDIVTEFFIEKCMQEGRLLGSSDSILFRPTKVPLPSPSFASLSISLTGFNETDRNWIRRMAILLGASFTESFSRKNTHLIVKDLETATGPKVEKAREWGVVLTTEDWLYDSIRLGIVASSQKSKDKDLSGILQTTKASKYISQSVSKSAQGKLFVVLILVALRMGLHLNMEKVVSRSDAVEVGDSPSVDINKDSESLAVPAQLQNQVEEALALIDDLDDSDSDFDHEVVVLKRRITEVDKIEMPSPKKILKKVEYIDAVGQSEQMRLLESLTPSKPKVFMFSGISVQERSGLTRVVEAMGGSVLESETWNPQCTHLIVHKIVKTEKFLAACASCAWVLKPNYLIDCQNQGGWMEESKYVATGNGTPL